eukprot:UN27145
MNFIFLYNLKCGTESDIDDIGSSVVSQRVYGVLVIGSPCCCIFFVGTTFRLWEVWVPPGDILVVTYPLLLTPFVLRRSRSPPFF